MSHDEIDSMLQKQPVLVLDFFNEYFFHVLLESDDVFGSIMQVLLV